MDSYAFANVCFLYDSVVIFSGYRCVFLHILFIHVSQRIYLQEVLSTTLLLNPQVLARLPMRKEIRSQ